VITSDRAVITEKTPGAEPKNHITRQGRAPCADAEEVRACRHQPRAAREVQPEDVRHAVREVADLQRQPSPSSTRGGISPCLIVYRLLFHNTTARTTVGRSKIRRQRKAALRRAQHTCGGGSAPSPSRAGSGPASQAATAKPSVGRPARLVDGLAGIAGRDRRSLAGIAGIAEAARAYRQRPTRLL
jgi:hypothetical protein